MAVLLRIVPAAVVLLHYAVALSPSDTQRYGSVDHAGFAFGADSFTAASIQLDGQESFQAISSVVNATGATHVRILFNLYMSSETSPVVYAKVNGSHSLPGSPFQSSSPEYLAAMVKHAEQMGLYVTVSPVVDYDWDFLQDRYGDEALATAAIGQNFTESQQQQWFASYTKAITPYFYQALGAGASMLVVGSGMDFSFFKQPYRWLAVCSHAKSLHKGHSVNSPSISSSSPAVTLAVGPAAFAKLPPSFWDSDSIDFVGLAPWYGHPNVNKSGSLADDLAQSWAENVIPSIESVLGSMATKKQLLVLEYGVQSRPNGFYAPRGAARPDEGDCSGWLECYDMDAQAEAFEGFFRALTPKSWFGGVYWWMVRADPSAGGTSDSDYTPMGKPAAAVLQRWYGMESSVGGYPGGMELLDWAEVRADGVGSVAARAAGGTLEEAAPGTGSIVNANWRAIDKAISARDPARVPSSVSMRNDSINGFVFGGAAEWSSPAWRYDSPGVADSLRAARATGANAVEIIVQWFYRNNNDTLLYRVDRQASTLRTATASELIAGIRAAKQAGLRVTLTPMIDPDYDQPGNCRQCASPPGPGWRGTVGQHWGSDCSDGTPWGQWWSTYSSDVILPYARLCEAAGCDGYVLSHELQTAVTVCPERWAQLTTDVRGVFKGELTHAFNGPIVQEFDPKTMGWVKELDYVGVDCYYALGINMSTVPMLPWQNYSVGMVRDAWKEWSAKLGRLSQLTGLPIVCTEIGQQSRGWAYVGPMTKLPLPKGLQPGRLDCSRWAECYSEGLYAIYYRGMFEELYSHSWFRGFFLWLWRADPTAGGLSDDSFVPAGKPATLQVLADFWKQD